MMKVVRVYNVAHLRRAWAICCTARRGQPVTLEETRAPCTTIRKVSSDAFISVLPTR